MQIKIRPSRDMQGSSRRFLSLAITGALLAPGASWALQGPITADGEQLSPEVGYYFSTAYGQHVLQALNAGGITMAAGSSIDTSGNSAAAAHARGAGSYIHLNGTSVATSGSGSTGLYGGLGASIVAKGGAAGERMTVATSGARSVGVLGSGTGTTVSLEEVDIATAGTMSHGMSLEDGAFGTLINSNIRTTGRDAHGVNVSGSNATTAGSRVATEGDESHALLLFAGSSATVTQTELVTSGASAYGINANHGMVRLDLDRVTVRTSGEDAYGLFAPDVTDIVARDTVIETNGARATGLLAQGATITADGGKIHTRGEAANAVLLGRSITGEVAAGDFSRMEIRTEGDRSYGVLATGGAQTTLRNTLVETLGKGANGIGLGAGSVASFDATEVRTHGENAAGMIVATGAQASLAGSHVSTSGRDADALRISGKLDIVDSVAITRGDNAHGLRLAGGHDASLTRSHVQAEGQGSWAVTLENGGHLLARGSQLTSLTHGAFVVRGEARVSLDEGSFASGGNGILLSIDDVAGAQALALGGNSVAHGDIVVSDEVLARGGRTDGAAGVTVDLDGGSVWKGATRDAVGRVAIAGDSQWALTGDSRIGALRLDGGAVWFETPADGTYKTLQVAGDYTGTGGFIRMNAALAAGGALANQLTDRMLIDGNVSTTGTTYLRVDALGSGALTDTNRNGRIDADEGYSLVQVKGASHADAFSLAGGYVAAGPWQYTLQGFGPGELDASQNAFDDGSAQWDYRLGNRYVEDESRPAIVPQLPAYLSAPTALFAYGNQLNNGLHTRLGEISQASPNYEPHNAEMFVRYVGGQLRYRSDLNASRYGYGFDQQINALQLGGDIVTWTARDATFRAGWAVDHGRTDITPKADDGRSNVRFDAYGFLAWLTWYHDNGFYLDGVVGNRRYAGRVNTQARGTDMARMHANGWTASLESGHPFQVNKEWTIEPQAQLTFQQLRFRDIKDVDGLSTKIGTARQLQTRVGVRVLREAGNAYVPYGRFDVTHVAGGRAGVQVANDVNDVREAFGAGKSGLGYRVAGGVTAQLTRQASIYGEASYVGRAAKSGFKGWAASAGVRVNF